jgi:hypothetical protein
VLRSHCTHVHRDFRFFTASHYVYTAFTRCYVHTVPTFTATSSPLLPGACRLIWWENSGRDVFFSFPFQLRVPNAGAAWRRERPFEGRAQGLLGQDRGALAPSLQAPRRNGGPSARPRRQAPLGMGEARVCSRSAYHSGARGMLARGVQRIATSRRVWRMGGCVFALADACGVCSVTKTFRRLCSIASSRRSRSTPRTRYPTLFSRSTRQT